LWAPVATAQIQINSTPNPVGSGARAIGMGSAFIAVADDATAASWNPAGLTQLERPELSLVYSSKFFSEEFSSDSFSGIDGQHDVDIHDINYLSFVYPIPRTIAGRNLVLSINYLSQYDFDRTLTAERRVIGFAAAGGSILQQQGRVDYRQDGKLATVSPAIGFELTEWLSIGATMNLWHSKLIPNNEWGTRYMERNQPFLIDGAPIAAPASWTRRTEEYDKVKGTNFTAGILLKPTERLSIGAVYHSKLDADVRYTDTRRSWPAGVGEIKTRRDKTVTLPSAFGMGAAYRFPGDKLTLSFDVTRRNWAEYVIDDPDNPFRPARRLSGVTGQHNSLADIDPTWTVRFGGEYVFVNAKKPKQDYLPSVRAGVFYDPEPSGGRDAGFWSPKSLARVRGDGKPDDFFGFSLGTGVLIKNRVNLDAAYVFRFGNGVRGDTFGIADTDADVRQHYLYLSTVIYF
jgi:long-subunit fatty acid transport protein